MEHRPFREKLTVTHIFKVISAFMKPEGSLPCSQKPTKCPYPVINLRPSVPLHNMLLFYGEGLLAPSKTRNLGDHPLSALCDCFVNTFAAILYPEAVIFIDNLAKCHARYLTPEYLGHPFVYHDIHSWHIRTRRCIQKFPDWPPGARTANSKAPCH
jgi:hypothetical protein